MRVRTRGVPPLFSSGPFSPAPADAFASLFLSLPSFFTLGAKLSVPPLRLGSREGSVEIFLSSRPFQHQVVDEVRGGQLPLSFPFLQAACLARIVMTLGSAFFPLYFQTILSSLDSKKKVGFSPFFFFSLGSSPSRRTEKGCEARASSFHLPSFFLFGLIKKETW